MEQIRISRGIEVCVNDKEETIIINSDDTLWIDNFVKWLKKTEATSQEMAKQGDNSIDGTIKYMQELLEGMNELFGERASDKVFGEGVVPTPISLAEFIDLIIPIISKHAESKQKKIIEKYSKNRKGGRK